MTDTASNSSKTFDTQFELLKIELDLVNKAIGQQDEITKSIKNWSIVTWTASIGLAVSQPRLHPFLWLTAVIPFLFWFVDASFRRIQRSFIVRVKDIADYVNSSPFQNSVQSGAPIEFPCCRCEVPDGFVRIRHYGFLANRCRRHALAKIRHLIGAREPAAYETLDVTQWLQETLGIDPSCCPCCGEPLHEIVFPRCYVPLKLAKSLPELAASMARAPP